MNGWIVRVVLHQDRFDVEQPIADIDAEVHTIVERLAYVNARMRWRSAPRGAPTLHEFAGPPLCIVASRRTGAKGSSQAIRLESLARLPTEDAAGQPGVMGAGWATEVGGRPSV